MTVSEFPEHLEIELLHPKHRLGGPLGFDLVWVLEHLQQRDRLDKLGYEFAPLSQDWHLKAA